MEIERSHAGVGTEVYDGKDGGVERKSVFFIDEDLFVDLEIGVSGAESDRGGEAWDGDLELETLIEKDRLDPDQDS
jgi:hypothetical protein